MERGPALCWPNAKSRLLISGDRWRRRHRRCCFGNKDGRFGLQGINFTGVLPPDQKDKYSYLGRKRPCRSLPVCSNRLGFSPRSRQRFLTSSTDLIPNPSNRRTPASRRGFGIVAGCSSRSKRNSPSRSTLTAQFSLNDSATYIERCTPP